MEIGHGSGEKICGFLVREVMSFHFPVPRSGGHEPRRLFGSPTELQLPGEFKRGSTFGLVMSNEKMVGEFGNQMASDGR